MNKWGIDNFGENPVAVIKATKDRWIKARHDLEDAKYIEDLIHKDFMRSIRSYQTAWDYRMPTIKSAVDELQITDGRKKKPSLSCLNFWIKKEFFTEVDIEIKINKITSYGYEGYHWQMDFDIKGETYAISVPNKNMINMDNADHAYEGQFAFLHRTGKSSIAVEYTDYTEEGMAKFIKEYFENQGEKQK